MQPDNTFNSENKKDLSHGEILYKQQSDTLHLRDQRKLHGRVALDWSLILM